MIEVVFKTLFAVLWIIYIVIRIPYDKKYKGNQIIRKINTTGEKALLMFLSFGLVLLPLVWVFTPFLNNYKLLLPIWVRILGVLLTILSLVYFAWIHKTLGDNWSPTLEIKKEQKLITSGPYKAIRHPMYAQIWIWSIAQILIVSNTVAGFAGIIFWTILYFIRVPIEEKMLIEYFGLEYFEYMKRTGRVLPKIFD